MKRLIRLTRRRLYAILAGDDALDQACDTIPDAGCHEMPYNFSLNVANGAATKLAEQLAGPNLVLVWLLQLLGSPVWLLGFLMPIKQAGALLPQMVAAGQIRRLAVRKWVWMVAGVVQTLCLLLMIPFAVYADALTAGIMILLLFALFSVASGTASVAFQDVLGKTIIKGHRGKLLASRALVGGLLTMLAGVLLPQLQLTCEDELTTVFMLLGGGAVLWLVAALLFAAMREDPGETRGGRNAWHEACAGIDYFRRYTGFRRFFYARAMLLSVELATPFYFLHARELLDLDSAAIGYLVIAIGLSQVLSSPFWGRLADQTSKTVMAYSALMSVGAALLTLSLMLLPDPGWQQTGFLVVFVLIGLAEAGVRLGRKTYLVDALPASERASGTAFTNSCVGGLALLAGGCGFIAHHYGSTAMILLLAMLAAISVICCFKMPEADQMTRMS